jgi:hypothetical protein
VLTDRYGRDGEPLDWVNEIGVRTSSGLLC